jgi:electron transport complex protein RnfG
VTQSIPRKGGYIGQAWLVIFLALLYGGGLAGVENALSGKIEANKKAETYSVIPDLVPGADPGSTEEIMVRGENAKEALVYRTRRTDGSHVGWVLPAAGQGFADRIELLIGLDPDVTTIRGMYVLNQKETPGLGDYITSADFQNRFRDKPADRPVAVVKNDPAADNEIRALSGATISSESVAAIVNRALINYREPLRDLAAQRSPGNVGPGESTE